MKVHVILLIFCYLFSCFVVEAYPQTINVGVIASPFTTTGTIITDGTHQIAAIIMALKEINDKTDGIHDDLLPHTQIKFALRAPAQNFLRGLEAAQDMSTDVFGGKGIKAVIGAGGDETSRATGQVFGYERFKVNQIDFASAGSFLSHGDLYPYYNRVNPVDAFVGTVIAKFIKDHYGWAKINVFSTGDTYGTDVGLEFKGACENLGIHIENSFNFFPGMSDFSNLISAVKSNGVLKVFVLLMKASDAGPLLEQGYKAGLFGEGTQILATRYLISQELFKHMSKDAPIADIMHGVIGINSPYINSTHYTHQNFIHRFRAQNSTRIIKSDGSVVCSDAKDDDGNTYLYQKVNSDTLSDCTGLEFSKFAADGSDIAPTAFLAYDAVIAMAIALDQVLYKQNNVNFTGDDLREAIRTKVNFVGTSGQVDFNNGRLKSEGYGLGDRLSGLMYIIMNFNANFFHGGSTHALDAYRTVGFYAPNNGRFIPCDMWMDITCSKPVYNTPDGKAVIDSPTVVEVQMPSEVRMALSVAAAIALAVVTWFTFIVVLYMDDRIIKSAQPNMLLMMLFGGFLGSVRIILATLDLTDTVCTVGKWFGHLAFVFVFGAMIVKTRRVGKVVNSGFAKVKVTQADADIIFWSFIFCFCVYMVFDTVFGKPHRAYEEYFDGHNMVHLIKCKNVDETTTSILFAVEGLMVAYGAHLCWTTKEVPGAVNDSSYISLALFLILFVCALTFPIVFLSITPTPTILMTIMSAGFFIAVCGCIIIMFAPKMNLIFSGAQIDENLKIVHGARRADGSSTSDNVVTQLRNKIRSKARGVKSTIGGGGGMKTSIRNSEKQLESIGERNGNDRESSLMSPVSKKSIKVYKVTSGKYDSERVDDATERGGAVDISGARVHSEFLADTTSSGLMVTSRYDSKALKGSNSVGFTNQVIHEGMEFKNDGSEV
eukprot:gene10083-21015_t